MGSSSLFPCAGCVRFAGIAVCVAAASAAFASQLTRGIEVPVPFGQAVSL